VEAALFFSFATDPQCDSGPRLPFSAGGQKGSVTGPGSLILPSSRSQGGVGTLGLSRPHSELGADAIGETQAGLPGWLSPACMWHVRWAVVVTPLPSRQALSHFSSWLGQGGLGDRVGRGWVPGSWGRAWAQGSGCSPPLLIGAHCPSPVDRCCCGLCSFGMMRWTR
jgi:hypothetical protein